MHKNTQSTCLLHVPIFTTKTLTFLFVLVNIMAPVTRRTKRRSSSFEDPDLAGPHQKKLKFRRSKGGTTPSLIVKFPHSAKEHFTEPDAGATPSLIATSPRSAEEHPARPNSTERPPAKAPRGRPPKNKQIAPLTVTFLCSAKEHPAKSHSTESPPAKAPRGRPPGNKQKASLIITFPRSAKEHTTEPDAGATPTLLVPFPCSAEAHPIRHNSTESPPATAPPRGRPPRIKQKADQQNNSFSVDTRPKSWGMPEVWAEVFH